jgi:hypothetical protein
MNDEAILHLPAAVSDHAYQADPPAARGGPAPSAPFTVEHVRAYEKPGGIRFTPGARLLLTRALRTSGLLRALPDAEARSLLWLLTYLRPDGRIEASVAELAATMEVPEAKARARMDRLVRLTWRGNPVVTALRRDSGLDSYILAPHLVEEVPAPSEPESASASPSSPPFVPAGREAVVSHSRAAYARPRAEVERQILEQLGHSPDEAEDTPGGEVRRRLRALGVPREQADLLLAAHPLDAIQDQLDWLPYRQANNPARFLVAAVENRYEPPARIRLERALAAEAEEEADSTGAGTAATSTAPPLFVDADEAAVPEVQDDTSPEAW